VHTHGLDELHRHIDGGRGVLLFGSHLGSFEVLRVLSRQRPDVPIRVVLDRAHSASVTALLEAINPEVAATVIDAGQDGPAIMLAIQEAASQGAMIALLVDRTQPGEPSVTTPFLGAPARFPLAPWLIAAVLKIPVVLAFGLYRGGNRYDLVFEPFSDGIQVARRERAAALPALITRYAAQLEDRVRDAPYNWFNFYDFWERGDDGVDPSAQVAGPVHEIDPAPAGTGGDRAVRAAAVPGAGAAGRD
jgi:predicted LPLAT superfamily acyltransferase